MGPMGDAVTGGASLGVSAEHKPTQLGSLLERFHQLNIQLGMLVTQCDSNLDRMAGTQPRPAKEEKKDAEPSSVLRCLEAQLGMLEVNVHALQGVRNRMSELF